MRTLQIANGGPERAKKTEFREERDGKWSELRQDNNVCFTLRVICRRSCIFGEISDSKIEF